jgi:hypothetical protein
MKREDQRSGADRRLFTSEHLNHRKITVSDLKAEAKVRQPLPVLAPGSIAAVPPGPDGKKPSPGSGIR